MQRQLSAVSLFTSLISLAAATLITMQLQQADLAAGWRVPSALLWTLEAAVYAMVVYGWQPSIGAGSWALAVGSLLVVRSLIGVASGFAVIASGSGTVESAIGNALADLPARACGVVFTIMVVYPLRSLLPSRNRLARARLRGREGEGARAASGSGKEGSGVLLLMEGGPTRRAGKREQLAADARDAAELLAAPELEGSVTVPLGALLPQLPQQEEIQATVEGLDRDFPVEVPLQMIVPQLREARLQVTGPELAQILPSRGPWSAFVEYLHSPNAVVFSLPLRVVIPQLPPEALELPAIAPPVWAKLEEEEEKLLFAVV